VDGEPGDGGVAGVVVRQLEEARVLGFLGSGPVAPHVEHARGFARAAVAACGSEAPIGTPTSVVDLGTGGGLPGLVLATVWSDATFVFVEASARRAAFLREAVVACGWGNRVEVVEARAEQVGREPARRGASDLVVARAFGPPAVAAECGAPLLRVGGRLVVSEPPGDGTGRRWPEDQLESLGLGTSCTVHEDYHYRVTVQARPCPDRYPRRVGVPAKRPLF
jgi:16S rRNA (guanine527-N7)-methyltransferase